MRPYPLLGILLAASVVLPVLRAAAPHPTVLTVQYKDQFLPVTKVIGSDPVVLVEGKEKRIRTEPRYLPSRIERYSEATVEVKEVSVGLMQLRMVAESKPEATSAPMLGAQGGRADFRASLRSSEAFSGGFVAVVMYGRSSLTDPAKGPSGEIVVHALPELPANTDVPVTFGSKAFVYHPDQAFFVQVFDREGREVMTNTTRQCWPYYAAIERFQLQETLRKVKASLAGKDLDARPVLRIKPLLPKSAGRPAEPVVAQITVMSDGTVSGIRISDTNPVEVGVAVREALEGWLFMPKVKAGELVPCTVKVPFTF